jgi:hypothetical protein
MNSEAEIAIKEYYDINEKIKQLEKRKSELKEVLNSVFESKKTNELKAENILIYRVNHPRISWDESVIKSILAPKGLWESVLGFDNKKVKNLINNHLISDKEIEEAKITVDTWYTYTEQVSIEKEIKPSTKLQSNEEIKGIKRVVINDLSRMKEDRVCIFGIDNDGKNIRPEIPYSHWSEKDILDENENLIIKPFAEIEFDFIHSKPKPPHSEDVEINRNYKPKLIRDLSEGESKIFLEGTMDESVKSIFCAIIHDNKYLNHGEGKRSLGTVRMKECFGVTYFKTDEGKYKFRIQFSDINGDIYDLKITDYLFNNYYNIQIMDKRLSPEIISKYFLSRFNKSEVFLRVGLARPFEKKNNRCYLQVSGIHTFPDYRKEFNLDLKPKQLQEACNEKEMDPEITKIDGTIIAQEIISCVSQVGESFGMRHIADVLCGSKSKKVIHNRHDTLKIYGAGKEYSREQWQDFIKELIQLGYLKSEGEIYPVIKQTQKSRDILSGVKRIFLTKPLEEVHIFDENFDRELFEILRILRKKLADEEGMPPYIIFHDSSLKTMATYFPQNQSDFQKISGVGERKIMKYGKLFLEEIIGYCKIHTIEPKADKNNVPGYSPETTTSTPQTPTISKPERVSADITRVSMSKHDMIGTLKKIILELHHNKEAAPLEEIISKAESVGIERDAVKEVIQQLKRTGEIYEVSNDRFRIVE